MPESTFESVWAEALLADAQTETPIPPEDAPANFDQIHSTEESGTPSDLRDTMDLDYWPSRDLAQDGSTPAFVLDDGPILEQELVGPIIDRDECKSLGVRDAFLPQMYTNLGSELLVDQVFDNVGSTGPFVDQPLIQEFIDNIGPLFPFVKRPLIQEFINTPLIEQPVADQGGEDLTFLEMAQLNTNLEVISNILKNLVSGQVHSPVSSPQVILKVYNIVDGVESPCPDELYNTIWDPVHKGICVDFAFQVPKACYIVEFQVQGLSFQASDQFELFLSTPRHREFIPCDIIAMSHGQWTIRSHEIPMRDPKKNGNGNVVRRADPFFVAKGVGFLKLICRTHMGPHVIARKRICIRSQQSSRRKTAFPKK